MPAGTEEPAKDSQITEKSTVDIEPYTANGKTKISDKDKIVLKTIKELCSGLLPEISRQGATHIGDKLHLRPAQLQAIFGINRSTIRKARENNILSKGDKHTGFDPVEIILLLAMGDNTLANLIGGKNTRKNVLEAIQDNVIDHFKPPKKSR